MAPDATDIVVYGSAVAAVVEVPIDEFVEVPDEMLTGEEEPAAVGDVTGLVTEAAEVLEVAGVNIVVEDSVVDVVVAGGGVVTRVMVEDVVEVVVTGTLVVVRTLVQPSSGVA